jgi:CubicO group peptidase (beta-lactamase class C family)
MSVRSCVRCGALLLLSLTSCGAGDRGGPSSGGAANAGLQARIERVEKGLLPLLPVEGEPGWTLAERMEHHRVPGASVAVIDGFRLAWARGYGIAEAGTERAVDEQTLFQAASISKAVTAMAVLRLVQEGRLDLDADARDYLTSWDLPGARQAGGEKITLRRLLSHSAGVTVHGFPGYEPGSPLPSLAQILDGVPPANTEPIRVDTPPGSGYRYSGGGFTVVQQILQDGTGETFPALMGRLVLRPAGMPESTFQQPLPEARARQAAAGHAVDGSVVSGRFHVYPEAAAAGLWTTPSDLARFAITLQDALRGDPGPVLSPEMAEQMATPVVGEAALGLFVERAGSGVYLEHGGANAGFRALLVLHRRAGYGAAVMANADGSDDLIAEIVRAVAREYRWEGYLSEPLRLARVPPADLARLAGRYQLDSDTVLVVTAAGDRLRARPTLGTEFELLPTDREAFRRRDREPTYRFTGGALKIEGGDEKRTAPRLGDDVRVPSELLESGREAEALAAYRALRQRRPDDPAVAEMRLNMSGYEALLRGDLDLAIAVFRVNTQLYPDSANTYDSLGEALWAAGRREEAGQMYRKVLETLPRDRNLKPSLAKLLRDLAESHLREIEGS